MKPLKYYLKYLPQLITDLFFLGLVVLAFYGNTYSGVLQMLLRTLIWFGLIISILTRTTLVRSEESLISLLKSQETFSVLPLPLSASFSIVTMGLLLFNQWAFYAILSAIHFFYEISIRQILSFAKTLNTKK